MDYIEQYMKEIIDITKTIDQEKIHQAVEILFDAWKNGNQVFVAGCGGSASTASHFTADLSKTTLYEGKQRFKAISLVDNTPVVSAWANDNGWDNIFIGQLENLAKKGDVFIGISVHGGKGWSNNLVKAMEYMNSIGGRCIGLSGFDGGRFNEVCETNIIVPKESTPLVEGFHGDIQHLIIFKLKEMIELG